MTDVITRPLVYFVSILATFLNYAEMKDMYFNYRLSWVVKALTLFY